MVSLKFKRVIIGVSCATFSVALWQANIIRNKYADSKKLDPPNGPSFGSEKWVSMKENNTRIMYQCLLPVCACKETNCKIITYQ